MHMKAVVFDLYGTLADFKNKENVYKQLFKIIEKSHSLTSEEMLTLAYTENLSFEAFFKTLAPKLSIKKYRDKLHKELTSITLFPETIETLTRLKKEGIVLGLLSNCSPEYKKPFYSIGLNEFFDVVIFSCDVGIRKPDPGIYDHMIYKVGFPPFEVLMVGDNEKDDIAVARIKGINTLLIDRKKHFLRDIFALT